MSRPTPTCCLVLAGLLSGGLPASAAEASAPPWWDRACPVRIRLELEHPPALWTEQPVNVPFTWPAEKARGLDLDWLHGRAVEVTESGAKPIGPCQRSAIAGPAAADGQKRSGACQLVFMLPPRRSPGPRRFHLYFPRRALDRQAPTQPPIAIEQKKLPVRGKEPVTYHEVRTALPPFSLRPGWNSVAGVHGFRPEPTLAYSRFLRFYRMAYRKKTLSPNLQFRPLEVGAARASLLMAPADGSAPHKFLWHIYANGDIRVEHRWLEGTDHLYWTLASGAKPSYWQLETARFPQERGQRYQGGAARFLVQQSEAGRSLTLLFDRRVGFNVAFSAIGRWERLMMRYRKVGLDQAFDDAEAICDWMDAADRFRVGPIDSLAPPR